MIQTSPERTGISTNLPISSNRIPSSEIYVRKMALRISNNLPITSASDRTAMAKPSITAPNHAHSTSSLKAQSCSTAINQMARLCRQTTSACHTIATRSLASTTTSGRKCSCLTTIELLPQNHCPTASLFKCHYKSCIGHFQATFHSNSSSLRLRCWGEWLHSMLWAPEDSKGSSRQQKRELSTMGPYCIEKVIRLRIS